MSTQSTTSKWGINIGTDNVRANVVSHEIDDVPSPKANGTSRARSQSQIQTLIEQLRDKENALDCTQQLVQNLMLQVERLQLENEQLRQQSRQRTTESYPAGNCEDQVVRTNIGPTSGPIPRPPSCASGLRLFMSDSSLTALSRQNDSSPSQGNQLGDRFALQRSASRPTEATTTTAVPTLEPNFGTNNGIRRPPSCASGIRFLYGGMSISSFSTAGEPERSIENIRARVVVESMPNRNAEMFQLRRHSDSNETPCVTENTPSSDVAQIPSSARIPRGFSTSSISTISEGTSFGCRRRRANCGRTSAPRKRSSTNVRTLSSRARNSDNKNADWGDNVVVPSSNASRGVNALLRKANSLDPNF